MSRDILEKAFNKTKEMEEESLKKIRAAQQLGRVIGIVVAFAVDTTAVWLVVKFLLGFASFSWVSALGVMILVSMLKARFDQGK